MEDGVYARAPTPEGTDVLVKDAELPFAPPRQRSLLVPIVFWLSAVLVLNLAYDRSVRESPSSARHSGQPDTAASSAGASPRQEGRSSPLQPASSAAPHVSSAGPTNKDANATERAP